MTTETNNGGEVKILPRLKNLIHPLTPEEKTTLERDILDKGCLDPLKTWQGYLIDGHHRYAICTKHSVNFKTEELSFSDEESAKLWMISNQLGRRNITDAAKIKYALLSEEIEKDLANRRMLSGKADPTPDLAGGSKGEVRDIIAKKAGVGHTTVDKFKKIQAEADPETVQALCDGTPVKGKKLSIDKVYREIKKQEKRKTLSKMEFPKGKYRVIYADPPWQYSDKRAENTGGAEDHYPTMTISELCDIPIADIADDNAVLFLWTTSPFLEDSFKIINSWGFSYKSSFVWDKVKHNMGHYNSVRHELLLIATKGSCTPDHSTLIDSVQSVERTEKHSEKPEEFRQIIETLYIHGNKLELFARTQKEGWEVYGNELAG